MEGIVWLVFVEWIDIGIVGVVIEFWVVEE